MQNINEFIDACRGKGLNVTYQRLLIYKSLNRVKSHPTAEEIYQEVRKEYPSISLATVYKTLETLAENQLISKVTSLHDLARYDGDTSRHHHLVCLRCRKVVDIHDESLNQLNFADQQGFKVSGYRIQVEGICADCSQSAGAAPSKNGGGNNVTFCGKE